MPKFAIANYNFFGLFSSIPELANLTLAEQELLSLARTGSRRTVIVTYACPKRVVLKGHVITFEQSPDALVEQLEDESVPPVIEVHLCTGTLDSEEQIAAAVAAAKAKLLIDKRRFLTAFSWLQANHPAFASLAPPLLDLNADAIQPGALVVTADTGDGDIADPANNPTLQNMGVSGSKSAQASRATLLINDSLAALDNKSNILVRGVAYSAGDLYPSWDPAATSAMYPLLFPYGRGWNEARPVPMSPREIVALTLRLSTRQFSTHPTYQLERYSLLRRQQGNKHMFGKLLYNPKLVAHASSVNIDDMKTALVYYEDSRLARKNGQPPPHKPAISEGCETLVRALNQSNQHFHCSDFWFLDKRNKLFALSRMFGNFSIWDTSTPEDLNSVAHALLSNGEAYLQEMPNGELAPDPACTQQMADHIASDSAACAQYHIHMLDAIHTHLLGWDRVNGCSSTGGGLFGEVVCYGGPTENQARGSLHRHELATTKGQPISTSQLVLWLSDPNFIRDFSAHAANVAQPHHGVSISEMVEVFAAHEHAQYDINCACFQSNRKRIAKQIRLEHPFQQEFSRFRGRSSKHCLPLLLTNPSKRFTSLQGVAKGLSFPKTAYCPHCGFTASPYDLQQSWALANCSATVKRSFEAGDTRLQSATINIKALLGLKGKTACRQARAALALVGMSECGGLIHDPGHRAGCFKSGFGCRYGAPYTSSGSVGIVLNGEPLDYRRLAQSYDLQKILSLDVHYGPLFGCNYTSPHNPIHLAGLRCNVNTKAISVSPGIIYYTTTYAAKLRTTAGAATKQVAALERQVERDKLRDAPRTPLGQAASTMYRLQYSSHHDTEVPITIASLWLMNKGETFHFSHKFVGVPTFGLIMHMLGKSYTAPAFKQGTRYVSTTRALDYAHRGRELETMEPYTFFAWYHKRKGVLAESKGFSKIKLLDTHPQFATHYLQKRQRMRVPVLHGSRIPSRSCLAQPSTNATKLEYIRYSLACYSPWREGQIEPTKEAQTFDAWHMSPTAIRLLENEQNYYDQKKIAASMREERKLQLHATMHSAKGYTSGALEPCSDEEYDHFPEPVLLTRPRAVLAEVQSMLRCSKLGSTLLATKSLQLSLSKFPGAAPPGDWNRTPPTSEAPPAFATLGAESAAALVIQAVTGSAVPITPGSAPLPPLSSFSTVKRAFRLDTDAEQSRAFEHCASVLLSRTLRSLQGRQFLNSPNLTRARALLHRPAPILYVGGEGGCGKSNVISAISAFAQSWGLSGLLSVVAYTGSAASLINAQTLHSLLRLGVRRSSAPRARSLTQGDLIAPLASLALLIVDEISFIDAEMFHTVELQLSRLTGSTDASSRFGGVSLACFGDFFQLQPTNTKACLYEHNLRTDALARSSPRVDSGLHLWRTYLSDVVYLKHNYRAQSDQSYTSFLQSLRNGVISNADMQNLKLCAVSPARSPPLGSTTIYPFNKQVNSGNFAVALVVGYSLDRAIYRLNPTIKRTADSLPATCAAVGYTLQRRGKKANPAQDPLVYTDLFVGCKLVITIDNKQTKFGLCNGATGYLVQTIPPLATLQSSVVPVMLPTGETALVNDCTSLPTHLLIYVPTCTLTYEGLPTGVVPVPCTTTKPTTLYGAPNEDVTITYFQVRHGYCITCHKAQGKTLASVIIGKFSKRFHNYNYTALSRVASWTDLYILDPKISFASIAQAPLPALVDETKRLLLLELSSLSQ